MKKAALVLGTLVLLEWGLRAAMPGLGADLWVKPEFRESPFLYDPAVGYEPKAFAEFGAGPGSATLEKMTRDGFRGPDASVYKAAQSRRILALGDSVVQGFSVVYSDSWEKELEDRLNAGLARDPSGWRYDVVNAGVGGYLAWQAHERLVRYGLKYNADLVLVLVGWNDLLFSSLPDWRPRWDLSQVERARLKPPPPEKAPGAWDLVRRPLYRFSYMARLAREVRNRFWNRRRERALILAHQKASGRPFNEAALRQYLASLEQIHSTLSARHSRMGLIVFPTLLAADRLQDARVHQRLLILYQNYWPLSTEELWAWYGRYAAAQRDFLARHPDVVGVDAAAAFNRLSVQEALSAFTDYAHLTPKGNRQLADLIQQRLAKGDAF